MAGLTVSDVNACDVGIQLDDKNGALRDISGSSNQVSMDLSQTIGTLWLFGSRFPRRKQCKSDATIAFRAVYTMATLEAMDTLRDWYFNKPSTSKRLQVRIPNGQNGADQYEFQVLLERLNIPVQATNADPILVDATLRPTGQFTYSVVAT